MTKAPPTYRRTHLFDAVDRGELSLRELARRLEVSNAYLCHIRKGKRPMTRGMEIRAAHLLGMAREQLYYDDDQPEVRAGSGPSPPSSRRPSETV